MTYEEVIRRLAAGVPVHPRVIEEMTDGPKASPDDVGFTYLPRPPASGARHAIGYPRR